MTVIALQTHIGKHTQSHDTLHIILVKAICAYERTLAVLVTHTHSLIPARIQQNGDLHVLRKNHSEPQSSENEILSQPPLTGRHKVMDTIA